MFPVTFIKLYTDDIVTYISETFDLTSYLNVLMERKTSFWLVKHLAWAQMCLLLLRCCAKVLSHPLFCYYFAYNQKSNLKTMRKFCMTQKSFSSSGDWTFWTEQKGWPCLSVFLRLPVEDAVLLLLLPAVLQHPADSPTWDQSAFKKQRPLRDSPPQKCFHIWPIKVMMALIWALPVLGKELRCQEKSIF